MNKKSAQNKNDLKQRLPRKPLFHENQSNKKSAKPNSKTSNKSPKRPAKPGVLLFALLIFISSSNFSFDCKVPKLIHA
ncbi:MAG: hypothetical protein WEC17_02925 [Candidatus Saccharimonadales bacterium]